MVGVVFQTGAKKVPSTKYEEQGRDSCDDLNETFEGSCLPTVGRPAAIGVHGTLYLVPSK